MKHIGKEATRWPVLVCAFFIVSLGAALPGQAAHALSVDITATPHRVDPNRSSTLKWTSSGAKWCWSQGKWGSGRPLNGTFDTGPLTEKQWYGITCSDGTNQVSDSVTVTVRDAPTGLSVELTATPWQVDPNGASTLKWTSTGAKWCWSRGKWGSGRPLNGTFHTGPLTEKQWYGITCSDGKNEVSDAVTVVVREEPTLKVELTATPWKVSPGGSSTLNWTSTGAKWCWSRGVWGSGRPLNGSYDTGPLTQKTWYGITCSNGSTEVSDGVTVVVDEGGSTELSVDLKANPLSVKEGEASTLSWSSQGADACQASGGWSGGRATSGTFKTAPLSQSTSYKLTCTRGSETALSSVTVSVATVPTVRWQAPTENVDGSALNDLAGYRVHFGQSSRKYSGSAKINSPDWTQYTPDHLSSGTWFIAVTALDTEGNESDYSNEIQVEIP